MNTGDRIKNIRLRMGYTQNDIAKIIGVKQMAVSAWEVGINNMSVKNAMKFIKLATKHGIHVTLEDIVGE